MRRLLAGHERKKLAALVARKYINGCSLNYLATRLGWCSGTIRNLIIESGVRLRSRGEGTQLSYLDPSRPRGNGLSGESHPAWNGGRIISMGYVLITVNKGRFAEHRIVCADKIKRKIKRNEVVHHINGDRLDNRPENLEVMLRSEHSRMHMTEIRRKQRDAKEKVK